jgi:hypothetical protein
MTVVKGVCVICGAAVLNAEDVCAGCGTPRFGRTEYLRDTIAEAERRFEDWIKNLPKEQYDEIMATFERAPRY